MFLNADIIANFLKNFSNFFLQYLPRFTTKKDIKNTSDMF